MAREKRVIDKDLFWAVVLTSEAYGGVGSGAFRNGAGKPLCVYGMAMEAGVPMSMGGSGTYYDQFGATSTTDFDLAVEDVRSTQGGHGGWPRRVDVLDVFEVLGIEPSE